MNLINLFIIYLFTGNFKHHPCDNFYMHACHDWILTNPKPEGEKRWNVFAVQYYKINKLVIGKSSEIGCEKRTMLNWK